MSKHYKQTEENIREEIRLEVEGLYQWERKWLFEFGKKNNYPGIMFSSASTGMKYAMGYDGSKEIWDMQVGGGKEDYINAACEYLGAFSNSGEEEL